MKLCIQLPYNIPHNYFSKDSETFNILSRFYLFVSPYGLCHFFIYITPNSLVRKKEGSPVEVEER